MTANEGLERLVGKEVDTVSFVRDYVEFRIDYNVLRALTPPEIRMPDGEAHHFPERGSRDALCTLIGAYVIEASELGSYDTGDVRFEFRTDRDQVLTIRLDYDSRTGPEAAHLVPADERGRPDGANMWIW